MIENKLSPSFSDEEKTAINAAIETLNRLLAPKLIALNSTERRRAAKVGDSAIPMLEKVGHYIGSNPEFIPPFGNAPDFEKDFATFRDLRIFIRELAQLTSDLDDTALLVGGEADAFARRYYASVTQAAKLGVPGAQAVYDDLRRRYEAQQRGRSVKTDDEKK
jgi:hypothetical protein